MTMLPLLDDDRFNKEKATLVARIRKSCSQIKDRSILDDDLIHQVMYFLLVNPNNGFPKEDIQEKYLNRLEDECRTFILLENSPQMTLLKMRKHFKKVFKKKDWTPDEVSLKVNLLFKLL